MKARHREMIAELAEQAVFDEIAEQLQKQYFSEFCAAVELDDAPKMQHAADRHNALEDVIGLIVLKSLETTGNE